VDLCTKVGECGTNIAIELTHPRFVGSHVRLRRMVDEIVGEQLLENIEVSPPLDLFGISAHNGFAASDIVALLI